MGFSSGHVSNVEHGHVTPSQDFVDVYIRLGAARSAVQSLLETITDASRESAVGRRRLARGAPSQISAPQSVDETTDPNEIRRHYVVDRYDVEFFFGPAGEITRVLSSVYLRASSPNVVYYYSGHAIDDQGTAIESPTIEVAGATLERVNPSTLGAFNMFFRLDRMLSPDDPAPHPLRYEVALAASHRADNSVVYVARRGVRSHTAAVQFEEPTMPRDVWWFATSDSFESSFPTPRTTLAPFRDGGFEHTFDSVVAGWTYGLTWRWPQP